jgi:hypothetical protein
MFIHNGYYTALTVDAEIDISTASVVKILYQKPDGSKGEFSATASGQNAVYVFSSAELDMVGSWLFQVKYTIGAKIGYSRIYYDVVTPNLSDDLSGTPAEPINLTVQKLETQTWNPASGDNVTITEGQAPTSKEYVIFVMVNGQARHHEDDAGVGELSWTISGGVITFSEDVTGDSIMAAWVYEEVV